MMMVVVVMVMVEMVMMGVDDLEKTRHCGAKLEDLLDFNGVSADLFSIKYQHPMRITSW